MLIEIVIAVGVLALVLVGVADLMTRSAKVATFQKQRDEATNITQTMINSYRNQRDTDPIGFYNTVSSTVLDPCVEAKPYVCTVTVTKAIDEVMISIKTAWDDGGQTYDISLSITLARTIK